MRRPTRNQSDFSKPEVYARLAWRARFDPIWFAQDILRLKPLPGEPTLTEDPNSSWELDDWQKEMLQAMADVARLAFGFKPIVNKEGKQLISVVAGQGPGKTFGAAIAQHWFNFAFNGRIVCTAPKIQQVTTRMWNEFRKISDRAAPGYNELYQINATSIIWGGDPKWFAIAETAAQPENLQGFHDKYILVICDEASGVDESIFPVLRGAISTGKVAINLNIGNPTRNVGTFFDAHNREQVARDYYRMHVGINNSRRMSRTWAEAMIRSYGKDSPVVKIRVYGEFADSDAGQLVPLAWITRARMREFDPITGDGSLPRTRISIDVADGGEDKSVLTVAKHYQSYRRFMKQTEHAFPSAEAPIRAADAAEMLWQQYGCSADNGDDIVVDSLGVGAGTAGTLIDRGYPVVVYKGGEGSDDPAQWRNRRVQSYIGMRNDFRDNRIVFDEDFTDDWAAVEAQICTIRTRPGQERVEDLKTKEEMKREGLKSPDRADSMAMQYATQAPRLSREPIDLSREVRASRSTMWDGQ